MYQISIVTVITLVLSYVLGTEDLSYLDYRNRNLMKIPDLTNLSEIIRHLDFSNNNIEIVHPITVPYPLSIIEVSLSHNKINTIVRGAFDNLTNLENLDLSYNQISGSSLHIETFKYEIGHFKRIIRLNLRGNHLGTLERLTFTAYGFSTLKYLDLSGCYLRTLDHMSIDNLANLYYLNLSYNLLKQLEALSLEGLMELETIDLSNNKITILSEMPKLLKLKKLILDRNGMQAIKENIFSSLFSLEVLSLKGNNFRTLSPHILPLDSRLTKVVNLEDNPWHCDCNMRWLVEDKDDQFFFPNFTLKCIFPSRLRKKNIFDVPSKDLICMSEHSRLIYTLILFFALCFALSGIGGLFYLNWKSLPCYRNRDVQYIAVITNDETSEKEVNIQITSLENESLVKMSQGKDE